jgi:bacterioferritin (cytochrome b1)
VAKLELFGGNQQVPVESSLLLSTDEETGKQQVYVTLFTGGPPFGSIPCIRPFTMKDGDLYGTRLREILQHDLDHNGENCLKTQESFAVQAKDARYLAYFFEEFAAKFHQKALHLESESDLARMLGKHS